MFIIKFNVFLLCAYNIVCNIFNNFIQSHNYIKYQYEYCYCITLFFNSINKIHSVKKKNKALLFIIYLYYCLFIIYYTYIIYFVSTIFEMRFVSILVH